tara:strand:+ start:431 stop:535 length:105 start_codon:yes stop_codon:yes gene_type:complete
MGKGFNLKISDYAKAYPIHKDRLEKIRTAANDHD